MLFSIFCAIFPYTPAQLSYHTAQMLFGSAVIYSMAWQVMAGGQTEEIHERTDSRQMQCCRTGIQEDIVRFDLYRTVFFIHRSIHIAIAMNESILSTL